MKKNIIILLSLLVLTSCTSSKTEEIKKHENLINKTQKLEQQVMNGKISEEDYKKQNEKLEQEMLENSKKLHNAKDVDIIPSWAKKEGFRKIEGLDFDNNASRIETTSVVTVYFSSNYDKIIEEANKLAKDMNVKEASISPRLQLKKMLEMMPNANEEMKKDMKKNMSGVMFANCTMGKCSNDIKFLKMVTVAKKGDKYRLEAIIQDYKKAKQLINK